MSTTVIGINSLLGLALAKKKYSKSPICWSVKTGSSTNNQSVICDAFNKDSYTWEGSERLHKYRGCGSREHVVGNYTKKK